MGLYQVGKPLSYREDVADPNSVKDVAFDSENSAVDKIFIHDDNKLKLNG